MTRALASAIGGSGFHDMEATEDACEAQLSYATPATFKDFDCRHPCEDAAPANSAMAVLRRGALRTTALHDAQLTQPATVPATNWNRLAASLPTA